MSNISFTKHLHNKEYKKAAIIISGDNILLKKHMTSFFKADNARFNQKFSNVLQILKNDNLNILTPYYSEWINILLNPKNDNIHRNTYRFFQDVKIPEENRGLLYDLAFKDFQNIENAIAIRVFAMTTCYNIALEHRELLIELKEAIEIASISDSPGIKSRSSRLISAIKKAIH